jgi:Fic-DOC domain mobile mystery protein B
MFDKVWKWAAEYRKTEKNMGINPPFRIQPEVRQIIEDAKFWLENKSYPPDEIAVGFHHRLVSVHPFPNGNGRWSRLAADLLIVQQGGGRLTWGRVNLQTEGDVRRAYIDALHAADNHDLEPLIKFARS